MDGTTLIVAEAATKAAELELFETLLDRMPNGHVDAPTNGHSNGHGNGHSDGHGNGRSNGQANGHANGHANVVLTQRRAPTGYTNGQTVARTNGNAHARINGAYPPGYANGHANGRINGHANGHANVRTEVVTLVASPLAGSAFGTSAALPGAPSLSGEGPYERIGKRVLDVLGASVALVVLSPVILFAALLVKLTSRGPALYKSTRLGRHGHPFTFYKLRSMYIGADADRDGLMHLNEADGPVFKLRQDPRVTRVGQWLRSTSIDELPQLVNVLKGDMSLVGPRPPLPEEAEKYEAWQRRRLDVRPGITCLWQISGRSRLGFEEWMRLDLEYIRRQSLTTDVWILLRTVPAVLSREGAY